MNKRGSAGRRLVGLLFVVLLIGGLAWWQRDSIVGLLNSPTEATEVSLAAAEAAEAKLASLRTEGEPVRLNAVELASLFRYRAGNWATSTLRDPVVVISADTLELSGMIATDMLPSHPALENARLLLPDTARVDLKGRILPLEGGGSAFQVIDVDFAGVPVPRQYYGPMLERLGRRDAPGLPADALALRLPPGAGSVRLEDGFLVLSP